MKRISHERIIKGVMSLGLSQSEAEVYVHLAEQGPQSARNIAQALKTQEALVYNSLRNLKRRKIVSATPRRPAEFSAISFEKALEVLVKAHVKESQNIEQERDKILSQWRSIIKEPRRLRHEDQ